MNGETQSSDLFAEKDLPRIFRRSVADVDPENPPDGYQPVLEVTIPGAVSFAEGAREPVFEPAAVGPADCEWDTHRYVDLDAKLMNLLTEPFVGSEPINLTGLIGDNTQVDPTVDPSRRMFVAYFDEVLDDFFEAVDPDDPRERRLARQLATSRVSAHEIDGHFQSLIHPETACPALVAAWTGVIHPIPLSYPLLAHRFEEVRAIVAEEEAFERVVDPDQSAHRAVANKVARHARSRHQNDPGNVIEILGVFNKHLTRPEIIDILDIPRETNINPEIWIWHVLHDLVSGRATEPAAFRTDAASYWDVATSQSDDWYQATSYANALEGGVNERAIFLNNPFHRAQMSTVEAVSISDAGVTRRFLAYDPSVFIDGAIRELLFRRKQLAIQKILVGQKQLLNNGLAPGAHDIGFQFSDNLFKRVMNNEITSDDLGAALGPTEFDINAHRETVYQAIARVPEQLGFNSLDDTMEWIGDEYWDAGEELSAQRAPMGVDDRNDILKRINDEYSFNI